MKSSVRCTSFLFTFLFVYESKLSTLLEMQKASRFRLAFLSSGDRTRTDGLRVMSPTSYQLLHPAIYFYNCFTISNSGFYSRRATPPRRTPPRNIFLVIAIVLYSFSFGELNVQTLLPRLASLADTKIRLFLESTIVFFRQLLVLPQILFPKQENSKLHLHFLPLKSCLVIRFHVFFLEPNSIEPKPSFQ